jgi:bifunctional non-homologous end joining protein LigD
MPKLRIDSHSFEISNLDKIIFPRDKITKGELIGYYMKVADKMLPHIKDKPITLFRYPDGISRDGFVQQEASDYFPDWIKRAKLKKKGGGTIEHVLCDNAATLAYLANQGTVTIHAWLSTADKPENPNRMIFDLDPSDNDFEPACRAARLFREMLNELGAPSYIMTTGSRGLHVVVPLDGSGDFESARAMAREIANLAASRHPDELTSEIRKEKRKGRLFIDVARNAFGQTAVAPYSLRAIEGAPVATPLDWDELSNKSLTSRTYTISNIFKRLGQTDDPWREIEKKGISLRKISLEKAGQSKS